MRRRVHTVLAWAQRLDARFGVTPAKYRPRDRVRNLAMLGGMYFVAGGIFTAVAEIDHWSFVQPFIGIAAVGLTALVVATVLSWVRSRNNR